MALGPQSSWSFSLEAVDSVLKALSEMVLDAAWLLTASHTQERDVENTHLSRVDGPESAPRESSWRKGSFSKLDVGALLMQAYGR